MNFTGSTKIAQTINGSIPGPLLRWREGDTVTLRVANQLDEDTSIHWHGIVLPADMDGVPGLSFHGIRPRESYTYHFRGQAVRHLLVSQPLRIPGAARRLWAARDRSARAGSDRVRSRARHPVVRLDRRGSRAGLQRSSRNNPTTTTSTSGRSATSSRTFASTDSARRSPTGRPGARCA